MRGQHEIPRAPDTPGSVSSLAAAPSASDADPSVWRTLATGGRRHRCDRYLGLQFSIARRHGLRSGWIRAERSWFRQIAPPHLFRHSDWPWPWHRKRTLLLRRDRRLGNYGGDSRGKPDGRNRQADKATVSSSLLGLIPCEDPGPISPLSAGCPRTEKRFECLIRRQRADIDRAETNSAMLTVGATDRRSAVIAPEDIKTAIFGKDSSRALAIGLL